MYFSRIKNEKPEVQKGPLNKHIGKYEVISQQIWTMEIRVSTMGFNSGSATRES